MFDEFKKIYNTLESNGVEKPLDETLKLYDILSKRVISNLDQTIHNEMSINFEWLAKQRKIGKPTEYILGKAAFMGQLFDCSPDTLIPRQETELLTKISIDLVNNQWPEHDQIMIIDMGTGCGNIAVSIALNAEKARVIASDLYDSQIKIAWKNVQRFKLQERISLFCGDLFSPLENKGYENCIDMVVCNPPYIPTAYVGNLEPEARDNEPLKAFDGGPYGIDIFRRLINDSVRFLKKSGVLIFEIGAGQKKLVTRLIQKNGNYDGIEYFDDGEQVRVIKSIFQGL